MDTMDTILISMEIPSPSKLEFTLNSGIIPKLLIEMHTIHLHLNCVLRIPIYHHTLAQPRVNRALGVRNDIAGIVLC